MRPLKRSKSLNDLSEDVNASCKFYSWYYQEQKDGSETETTTSEPRSERVDSQDQSPLNFSNEEDADETSPEEIKEMLAREEAKNAALVQDVADLNALLDLYVREAARRDELEQRFITSQTKKLRYRVARLEDEACLKSATIDNLENTIRDLRRQLMSTDEEFLTLRLGLAKIAD